MFTHLKKKLKKNIIGIIKNIILSIINKHYIISNITS
jgi:hypothetical protein